MTIQHLSGSKQLITNRLGHCSSYNDVEVMNTSLASENLTRCDQLGCVIPTNIISGQFVQLAADNIDLNEETLDGKNTTHVTTMVIYQRGVFGPHAKRKMHADHSKSKVRSLDVNVGRPDIQHFGISGKCQILWDMKTPSMLGMIWKMLIMILAKCLISNGLFCECAQQSYSV